MYKKVKVGDENLKIYGKELTLDLYGCNAQTIRSKKKLAECVKKLCRTIRVKPYGKAIIKRFALHIGHAAGYSFVQLIESSLVSGHFSELWNRAYLNIFSCNDFDDRKAAEFAVRFFKAKKFKKKLSIR
jgi:S-adenosylmethionine/arginine decarboxylase-like enzyme